MKLANLFRIRSDREKALLDKLSTLSYSKIAEKVESGYSISLYYQGSQKKQPVAWRWAFDILGCKAKEAESQPKGILVIKSLAKYSAMYAISFGGGHFHANAFADLEFGFNFARRVRVKQTFQTVASSWASKKNKTISSFRDFDRLEINSGESYTKLKFEIGDCEQGDLIEPVVDVGFSLKFRIKDESVAGLVKLIGYVEQVLSQDIVTKIPVFQEVKDEAVLSVLESRLKAAFVGNGACVTISEFDVVGSEAVFNRADKFVIQTGAEGETDVSLTWQSIKSYCETAGITDPDKMLLISVGAMVNGNVKYRKKVRDLIDYYDEENRALLIQGKWYRFNFDYLERLRESLEEIPVYYNPEYDFSDKDLETFRNREFAEKRGDEQYAGKSDKELLEIVRNKYYAEYVFNLMRVNDGFELHDRRSIPIANGGTVELCDLRKKKTVFAVKIGASSSDLCYVVTQSEIVVDLYATGALPRDEKPDAMALWIVFEKRRKLEVVNNRLKWDDLAMLYLKVRIDNWRKKVQLAGMRPEIHINYRDVSGK